MAHTGNRRSLTDIEQAGEAATQADLIKTVFPEDVIVILGVYESGSQGAQKMAERLTLLNYFQVEEGRLPGGITVGATGQEGAIEGLAQVVYLRVPVTDRSPSTPPSDGTPAVADAEQTSSRA